jgi:membrane protein DedA with SNARE-associated domain
MFESFYLIIYNYLFQLGYFGIFLLVTIESSFIPFPSEIVMIPAGYLASIGKLNIYIAIILGILGSIFGALINYFIAYKFGRTFLHKHAKWFFTSEQSLNKMEKFFYDNGAITTSFGRLIPVVRQYISFPAGLSKMPITEFVFYTGLGAGIWVTILTCLGYFLGNIAKALALSNVLGIALSVIIALIIISYIVYKWIYDKSNVNV